MAEREAESTFVNVDFKNHPDLLKWMNEYVASVPDLSRGAYIRRLVRRDMNRQVRRQAAQAESPLPAPTKKNEKRAESIAA